MPLLARLGRLLRPSLSCQDVNAFLAAYLDGALEAKTHRQFEAHLAMCPQCHAYFAQYRATVELARDAADLTPPPALVEYTLAFLRDHLDARG